MSLWRDLLRCGPLTSVGIIGGGVGGLTAALALKKSGFHVTVFEQASSLSQVGAGIQLGPNAVHVLYALGLGPALHDVAQVPEAVLLRDGPSGGLLGQVTLGKTAETRFGAPYLQLHRAELIDVLYRAALAAGVDIHLGIHAQPDPSGSVVFGGKTQVFDLCVAANGLHAQARRDHLGGDGPQFSGYVAYRATVDARAPDPVATNWLGLGRHVVAYPVSVGPAQKTNIVAVAPADAPIDGWWQEVPAQEMHGKFANFAPQVVSLLAKVNEARVWGLHTHEPLVSWSNGRLVGLGDAVHAMVPFMAQGAAQAIEDAWVLASALTSASTVDEALRAYQTIRKPRAERVVRASRRAGDTYHMSGALRLVRNLALKSGVANTQTRFDWLYGYDPTKTAPNPALT